MPIINELTTEVDKLKKRMDEVLKKYISDSEKSGNTPDEEAFKKHIEDVATQIAAESLMTGKRESIKLRLIYYGQTEWLPKYKESLKTKKREVNNKAPEATDDTQQKSAEGKLKSIMDTLKKLMVSMLEESEHENKTPSYEQGLNYYKGLLEKSIVQMAGDNEKTANYLRSYGAAAVESTFKALYEASMKKKPRTVTNNFPWTDDSVRQTTKPAPAAANKNARPPFKSMFADTYSTFSGHDMVCVFELPLATGGTIARVVGAVQTITYSIHDEKTPVRCIGDMNAKFYVFGPRTIAGTLIFTVFNKHWLKDIIDEYLNNSANPNVHLLADELPPFNITVSCVNEYGKNARLSVYGVTFVNEGQVMSIFDSYTENTYQFYALDVDYLTDVEGKSSSVDNVNNSVNNLPKLEESSGGRKMPSDSVESHSAKAQTSEAKEKASTDPSKPSSEYTNGNGLSGGSSGGSPGSPSQNPNHSEATVFRSSEVYDYVSSLARALKYDETACVKEQERLLSEALEGIKKDLEDGKITKTAATAKARTAQKIHDTRVQGIKEYFAARKKG